jgi:drug/metabolite transporter (DMT)-like permease
LDGPEISLGEVFAFATAIFWAFAVIMFKKSGERVHPIMLNLFKDCFAFVLLIPTAYLFGQSLLRSAPTDEYLLLIASGIIGIGIADTFYFMSLNRMAAGLVAIIACLYSPSIITMSLIFLGESLTWLQITGASLIVIAVLTGVSRKGLPEVTRRDLVLGLIFGAIAVLSNATGIVMIKPLLERSPLLWVTEVRLLAGISSLLLVLAILPNSGQIFRSLHSVGSWRYTLAGSFFGVYLAMVFWLAGMKWAKASIASALNQTSNLFIVIFAALILKEKVSVKRAIGVMLGVTGAILVSVG